MTTKDSPTPSALLQEQEKRFEAATEIQKALENFFSLKTADRETKLGSLINHIYGADLNLESLHFVTNISDTQKLESASRKAARTEYVREDKSSERPFEGPHAVVLLNGNGRILSAASEPYGRVHLAYSLPDQGQHLANLLPYALAKAVIAGHLEKAGRRGGLNTQQNWEYIQSLLPPETPLFLGASTVRQEGNLAYVVGVSGAEQSTGFLQGLENPNFDPQDVNYEAGAGDDRFAHRVATVLLEPDSADQITEPVEYTSLRVGKLSEASKARRN